MRDRFKQRCAFDADFPVSRSLKTYRSAKLPEKQRPSSPFTHYRAGIGECVVLALFFEGAAQHFEVFGDLPVLDFQLFDALHSVHDGGVIPTTETAANFGQRATG